RDAVRRERTGAPAAALPASTSLAAPPAPTATLVPPPAPPRPEPQPRPRPTAVRPGMVKPPPPRHTTAAPEPEIPRGGPVCRECSQANAPGRRFCRRCGASLAEVAVSAAAPLPGWRRWWH